MKKAHVKKLMLEYLRKHPRSQACDLVQALGLHKSTITTYLQELETDGKVFRVKSSYQVFWSEKPMTITPGLLLSKLWRPGLFCSGSQE